MPTADRVKEPIHCPNCDSEDVVKYGETPDGKQRFLCKNSNCSRQTFILDYSYKGHLPEVKEQIIEMTLNGSGIRDIARVLQISSLPQWMLSLEPLLSPLPINRHLAFGNLSLPFGFIFHLAF